MPRAAGGKAPSRPEELREGVLANLASLQVDQVPVVNLRRHPESDVPFDEQVAAMVAIRDEGLIGALGLSNVTLEQYRSASTVTEVACVQNAYNLANRTSQPVLEECARRGIAFVPFAPLASGILAQNSATDPSRIARVAKRLGCTPAQVAIAWTLALSPHTLVIPGTSSIAISRENLAAMTLSLDAAALAQLTERRPDGT